MWFWDTWGGSAYAEDIEIAVAEAESLVLTVALAKSWTSEQEAAAASTIEAVAGLADDAPQFWALLGPAFKGEPALEGALSLGKVVATFEAAAQAGQTLEESREEGSVSTVVEGTLEQSGDDAAELWGDAKPLLGVAAIGWVLWQGLRMRADLTRGRR
jgi:hypothetical protein